MTPPAFPGNLLRKVILSKEAVRTCPLLTRPRSLQSFLGINPISAVPRTNRRPARVLKSGPFHNKLASELGLFAWLGFLRDEEACPEFLWIYCSLIDWRFI